jgi:hypothetical protein
MAPPTTTPPIPTVAPATPLSQAILLCGNGADLGDFKVFADNLVHNDISKRFKKEDIIIKRTVKRDEVFQAILDQPDNSIKELHIFSHSIGGGLYVGYHHKDAQAARDAMINTLTAVGRDATYAEVLQTEIGGILTDHLILAPYNNTQAQMKAKFASDATGKFWGCNAGVEHWIYEHDSNPRYWDMLNTQNTPKPSVAQAFATFWGIKVSGASSGSHIEVFVQKHWMTSDQYKAMTKHWPGSGNILRLTPDHGTYIEHTP